jgi:putative redox protein
MVESLTEITAHWKGNMAFVGQNEPGGLVQMGTLHQKPGISPMQLLLVAIAGCTGMDIVSILQKKGVILSDMEVRVSGKRNESHPRIWTGIHIKYLLWGGDIKPKDVEQAIRLSEEKYCTVGIMLGKAARITSEYQILESR